MSDLTDKMISSSDDNNTLLAASSAAGTPAAISTNSADASSNYNEMTEVAASPFGGDGAEDDGGTASAEQTIIAAEKVQHEEPRASARVTTVTLTCNVVGGGILSLSSGMAQTSLLLGIPLLLGNASITILNLYFIFESADVLDEYDYSVILRRALGERLAKFVLVCLMFYPSAALIAYARIVADAMPPVLINFMGADKNNFITNDICWIIIGGFVFFLMSCRRTLSELFVAAVFGLVTIVFAVLVVVIRFFDGSYRVPGHDSLVDPDFRPIYVKLALPEFLPLSAFALAVHNNAPHYMKELENRSVPKMMGVIKDSHIFILSIYLLCAIFGVLTFGEIRIESAKGNILNAYRVDDALVNVARLFVVLHIILVYPILQMAVRKALNMLLFQNRWLPMRLLVFESFCITLAACLIASVTPNIETVLSVVGSLLGTVVIFLAPSTLHLRLVAVNEEKLSHLSIAAYFSIIYGSIVGVLGLVATFAASPEEMPPVAGNMTNTTTTTTTALPALMGNLFG